MDHVDHQHSDGAGQGHQTQDGAEDQTLVLGSRPLAVGGEVDHPSDVLPHDIEHGGDKDVILDVEGIQIVEAVGEHGASAGGAVTVRL